MVGDVQGCDAPAVPGGGVRVPWEEEVDHVYLERWHNIYPETADNDHIIGKSLDNIYLVTRQLFTFSTWSTDAPFPILFK